MFGLNKQTQLPPSSCRSRYVVINNFKPPRCIKASFYIPENRFNFPTTKGFEMYISIKLVCNAWQFTFIFKPHQIIFIHYKSRIATAIRDL